MQNNRNRVEKELATILLGAMEQFDIEEIHICPLDALTITQQDTDKDRLDTTQKIAKKGLETGEQGQFPELSKTGHLAGCFHAAVGCQGTLFCSGEILFA